MKIQINNHKVSETSADFYFKRSFEIVFNVFNNIQIFDDSLVKEHLLMTDSSQLYESLKYHSDILYSVMYTKNYELLDNYTTWRYSVSKSRQMDLNYFLIEYSLWKDSINSSLYPANSSEINIIYDYLIQNFETHKNKSNEILKLNKESFNDNLLFEELLKNLLDGSKEVFKNIVSDNLDKFDNNIFIFIEKIFNPLLYKVGEMWQLNEITIAKEHLATTIIEETSDYFFNRNLENKKNAPLVVISTVGDESHNLGIKIIGKFLETLGFNVKNLSSKITNEELINYIFDLNPEIILLSVTLSSNLGLLQKLVNKLKEDSIIFNSKIIVGGQALFINEKQLEIQNADFVCKDLEDLKKYINNL